MIGAPVFTGAGGQVMAEMKEERAGERRLALEDMEFFSAAEFVRAEDWGPLMDPHLLWLMDAFRRAWGAPVAISPVNGALGRRLGAEGSRSDHNVDRWGMARAADLLPRGMDKARPDTLVRAYQTARAVGATAIGIYPDWRPHAGVHLAHRPSRTPDNPALWAMVRDAPDAPQRMTGLADVMPAGWRA